MAEQDYKFIEEKIEPKKKRLFVEAAKKWLQTGAQPTDTVAKLLKQAGIEK